MTLETGLQGEPYLPCRMACLLGTEAGDCRDRSLRRASLSALLMEQSFEDSRLFVTQQTQRQPPSSGNSFSYHNGTRKARSQLESLLRGSPDSFKIFLFGSPGLQISPEGPAGLALSPGPISVKRLEEQRARVEGASTVPTALHLRNFLVSPRAGGWPGFFLRMEIMKTPWLI